MALSRNTSAVNSTLGGSLPIGKPAAAARRDYVDNGRDIDAVVYGIFRNDQGVRKWETGDRILTTKFTNKESKKQDYKLRCKVFYRKGRLTKEYHYLTLIGKLFINYLEV